MKMIDKNKIEQATRLLLEGLGEDPSREGLIDTPKRVARMWVEMFEVNDKPIQAFESNYGAMIIVKEMPFSSWCEHHIVPFMGVMHIGYIPKQDGKVVGLSKLWRIAEPFTKRLQLQERLTTQIVQEISTIIQPMGVGVIIEARHLCYSKDTQFLTDAGWKTYDEITDEKLAQWSLKDASITYAKPQGRVRYRYNGPMVHFIGQCMDMLVTPDHRCIYKNEWTFYHLPNRGYGFIDARKITSGFIPKAGMLHGNSRNIKIGQASLTSDQYNAFMGMYLAEGWCGYTKCNRGYNITVTQNKESRGYEPYKKLLATFPFKFRECVQKNGRKVQFRCNSKDLYEHLKGFGKSRDKYIPDIIKKGFIEDRLTCLRYFWYGDGWENKAKYQKGYTTISRRLADDIQEILITTMTDASITERKNHGGFDIYEHRRNGLPKCESFVRKQNKKIVQYNDDVVCFAMPETTLITRRNGNVAISGNCMGIRGILKPSAITVTSAMAGVMEQQATREEFLKLVYTRGSNV